ncbi:MAG: DUF362 domain-containing protein [Anaerolineales bacterium]|nr:DUF362 domain-containing protein [Anaerolineales bacterium]
MEHSGRDLCARSRRSFLKFSAMTAGSAVLAGCRRAGDRSGSRLQSPTIISPTATSHPTPGSIDTPAPASTQKIDSTGRVVLVRTDDRSRGIRRALELWDHNTVVGKDLFLKPNLNSADPFPGSTDVETLHVLINCLTSMGADQITIGDRSGMGNTRAVMQSKGVFTLAEEMGLSTLIFDDLGAEDWEILQLQGSHWSHGFAVPKPVMASDGVVQTCCLKTHRYGGHFTLSLKNSVGLAAKRIPGQGHDYMAELHNSSHQRKMIAEINQAYQPELVVLDGMEAFVDGGPAKGTKVTPGVILVASDRVAIDAVCVAILRYYGTTPAVSSGPVFEQEQIARAVELGLGAINAEGIEIITGDDQSRAFADALGALLADSR